MRGPEAFVHGFTAPWRSIRLLAGRRDLWPLVLAPALITGLLLTGAVVVAVSSGSSVTLWLMPWLVRWPAMFAVVRALVVGLLAMALGASGYMLGALLSIPFNDHLSERVESASYELPTPLSVLEALPTSIAHSFLGVGLWMLLQVVFLPLQLAPGIGSALDFLVGTGLTAFFLSHQMMDGPMSRWRLSFREKLDLLWEHLGLSLGLGLAATLMLAVPVLNLFGLPVCVAAGALLFAEINPLAAALRRDAADQC